MTGSIYQRQSDGKWVAAVSLGGGKRVVRYATSEREARQKLAELHVTLGQGGLVPSTTLTLGEWIDHWLALQAPRLRPASQRVYRQVLTPTRQQLGHLRLSRLTPLQLATHFTHLQQQGRGPRSLQLAYRYLKSCLGRAVALRLIAANPLDGVPPIVWQPAYRRYWTLEETQRFLDVCLTTHRKWGPLLAFLAATGLRVSEALGLTWEDVDREARLLRVERALVWAGGSYTIGPPKTATSRRVVGLPALALRALETWQQNIRSSGKGPVFRNRRGEPPREAHLRERGMRPLCAEAGVPLLRVHDLRHVHAMLALEATRDPYAVQRHLGHAAVDITLRRYGYSTREERETRDQLDQLFTQKS